MSDLGRWMSLALLAMAAAGCGGGDSSGPQGWGSPPPVDGSANATDGGGGSAYDAPSGSIDAPAPPPPGPDAAAFAHDMVPFSDPATLCAYVNKQREGYSNHDAWEGLPFQGMYHSDRAWPLDMATDPTLMASAQAEAQRLAGGGTPAGQQFALNPGTKPIYIDGVNTGAYRITSMDVPGDWVPEMLTGNIYAGLSDQNVSARMGIFYQDPGNQGPVLAHIGCGAAITPDGQARFWVLEFDP